MKVEGSSFQSSIINSSGPLNDRYIFKSPGQANLIATRNNHLNHLNELVVFALSSKHAQNGCRDNFLSLLANIRRCSIQIVQAFTLLRVQISQESNVGWEDNFENLRKYISGMLNTFNWLREPPFTEWMGVDPYCNPLLLPGIVGGKTTPQVDDRINYRIPLELRVNPSEYPYMVQLSNEVHSLAQSWDDTSHQHQLRVLRAKALLRRTRTVSDSDPVVKFLTSTEEDSPALVARAAQVTTAAWHATFRVAGLRKGFLAWLGLKMYRTAARTLSRAAGHLRKEQVLGGFTSIYLSVKVVTRMSCQAFRRLQGHLTRCRQLEQVQRRRDRGKLEVYWTLWTHSLHW